MHDERKSKVLHDQSQQYAEFLRGDKALCVLERRKDPETFSRALADYQEQGQYGDPVVTQIHVWHAPEGIELVLARDFVFIEKYIKLLHAMDWDWQRKAYQRMLGRLFGYDDHSIAEFVNSWTPEYCQCSKCIGVHQALEALEE